VNATKRQPNNPDTWFHLGQFDLSTRAPEQAISSFQHAITLDQGLYQATLAIVRARAEIAAGR
jgi:cytochrome c-type biogenesis protein CcmH/NrfG